MLAVWVLRVDRYTSHGFSHTPCTCDHGHIVAQCVSGAQSFHPHAIHNVIFLSVRLLSLRICLFLVSLPFLLFLQSLLVLCPAHHLQCRHLRGSEPLHSGTMRSIALWRFTIFSQVMSTRGECSVKGVWRSRPRLLRPHCQGQSEVAFCYVMCCKTH